MIYIEKDKITSIKDHKESFCKKINKYTIEKTNLLTFLGIKKTKTQIVYGTVKYSDNCSKISYEEFFDREFDKKYYKLINNTVYYKAYVTIYLNDKTYYEKFFESNKEMDIYLKNLMSTLNKVDKNKFIEI